MTLYTDRRDIEFVGFFYSHIQSFALGSGLLVFAFVERKPARFVWETGAVSSPVAERRRRSGATPKAVESMPLRVGDRTRSGA